MWRQGMRTRKVNYANYDRVRNPYREFILHPRLSDCGTDRASLFICYREYYNAALRFALAGGWCRVTIGWPCARGDKSTVIATRRGKDARENYCYPANTNVCTMERVSGADPRVIHLVIILSQTIISR